MNIYDFQEKHKKEEIIEKPKEWIQLTKGDGISSNLVEFLETSSNNSLEDKEEKSTLVATFESPILVDRRFSEYSTPSVETSSRREYKE